MMAIRASKQCRFVADRAGTSAIEFAIIAPWFGLALAASIDLGGVLYTKFALDGALAATANYGMLNAANVSSSGGGGLATSLVGIVAAGHAASWTNATIVVNNGPSATLANGVASMSGSAAAADACYCPTMTGGALRWGSATTCGATCANGSLAGKYVTIVASHTYKPFFTSSPFIGSGVVSAQAVVQVR